ncbi:MAG: hypothetical protein WEC73_05820 [Chthoniobacterales bacterium]
MNLRLGLVPAALILASCVTPTAPPVEMPEANVLPLALDSDFEFRKTRRTLNQAQINMETDNPVIIFERNRLNFGALSAEERRQREGTYYDFFWRARRPAEVTVRFEYRQAKTGNAVMAQEIYVPDARGTMKSSFQVIGDNFQWDGPATAWRCLIIENNRIVAFTQSYLWK